MQIDLDDDVQSMYIALFSPIAVTTCYSKQNFEILMEDVLQIMLLVQYMHKWSIIRITSLSINIFAQLLIHFYSHNCSTHRVSAASEGVAMSVQKIDTSLIFQNKLYSGGAKQIGEFFRHFDQ